MTSSLGERHADEVHNELPGTTVEIWFIAPISVRLSVPQNTFHSAVLFEYFISKQI